ncbi:hypothetical protein [Parasutterella sp.]
MYKTIQGDTWDIVAKKLLGSEMYADKLNPGESGLSGICHFPGRG